LHKFPANMENNREFSAIATLLALRRSKIEPLFHSPHKHCHGIDCCARPVLPAPSHVVF